VKKSFILLTGLLVLSLCTGLLLAGCTAESPDKVKVITSTSIIAHIVERVGGDMVSVANIIPPAQCPGHFDVKPGDIQKLADAQLFIMHNWQGEKFSDDLITSANNENLTTVKIELAGNWMTPSVQREAADIIAAALAQGNPQGSTAYKNAAAEYKAQVTAKESEIKARLDQINFGSISVLCDEQQAGFIKWAGFNIASTYGRPDTFTPQVVKDLVDKGRTDNVTLIIDNMQTGGEPGKSLAEELNVKHIVLSNFPNGYENTGTWERAVDKNIELIMESISN